jgi:hypothetical protein
MCFSAVTTVLAAEPDARPEATNPQVKHNDEYGYVYTEQIGEDHTIFRAYQKNSVLTGETPQLASANETRNDDILQSPEKTRSLLRSLGMGEDFIDMLTEEDLREYARCKSIVGITSYTKTDTEGNVVNVSEEEATSNAGARSLPEQDLVDPTPGPAGAYSNTYEDAYMSMYYQVMYFGNGRYRFSVDATWLDEPFWRLTDSLGACAQGFAIDYDTCEGYYRCEETSPQIPNIQPIQRTESFGSDDFMDAHENGWDGVAVTFNLRTDISGVGVIGTAYENHMAHCHFYGFIRYPDLNTYFNTTATYSHSIVTLILNPSISISQEGMGWGIGLGVSSLIENRIVKINDPIYYQAD